VRLPAAPMKRYERVMAALEDGQEPVMRVFGNSMRPIIKTKSKLTFKKTDDYQVGDVVMARVKGRIIEAHKITRIDGNGRCMISNNHGYENGWASQILGRVIAVDGKPFGRK
jgi:SOS-response transcriptional repressor LexA